MQFDIKRIKNFLYLSLPALALSSCVYDDLGEMEVPSQEGMEKMYITLHIKTPDGFDTRAIPEGSDYVNGDEETEHPTENFVQGAHAFFFDGNGQYMTMADMVQKDMGYENGGNHHEPGREEDGIEASYTIVLSASKEKSEQPKKVLVVLNDVPIISEITKKANPGSTIKDFTDIIWTDLQGDGNSISRTFAGAASTTDGKGYLTLSNAAYLDNNGKVHYEYDIPEGSFKGTQEEAKKSAGVIVHVERMVSKFTPIFLGYTSDKLTYRPYDGNQLTIAHFDDDGEASYEAQNWNMTITGWGMNGLETKNYLYKKIQNKSYYGWNAAGTIGWNDENQWRSYWAEDPHYLATEGTQGIYPFQYRRAVEKNHESTFKYYGDQAHHGTFEDREATERYDWALKYFSFNELNDNNRTNSENYSEHAYAPENTYDESLATTDELDNRNNKIAGTHMLFCANLKVTNDGLSNFQPVGEHFYRDRIGICYYSDEDLFWGFTRAVNRKLESQGYMQYTYYTWDEDKEALIPNSRYFEGSGKMKLYYGDREIDYAYIKELKAQDYKLSIPAPILHGDGKVFPWITPPDGTLDKWLSLNQLCIRDENGDIVSKTYKRGTFNNETMSYEYEEIEGGFTVDDLASLFYEWCGAVDHYKDGNMYYAAPILHRKSEETNGDEIYGNVRNHWYQLKINTVLNLGTPVDDPDQRIIPDNVYGKDNVKVDIEILPWHLIDIFIDLPGYEKTNNLDNDEV